MIKQTELLVPKASSFREGHYSLQYGNSAIAIAYAVPKQTKISETSDYLTLFSPPSQAQASSAKGSAGDWSITVDIAWPQSFYIKSTIARTTIEAPLIVYHYDLEFWLFFANDELDKLNPEPLAGMPNEVDPISWKKAKYFQDFQASNSKNEALPDDGSTTKVDTDLITRIKTDGGYFVRMVKVVYDAYTVAQKVGIALTAKNGQNEAQREIFNTRQIPLLKSLSEQVSFTSSDDVKKMDASCDDWCLAAHK